MQAASDIYQQILNVNVLGPTLVTRAATNLIDHTMVSSGNRGQFPVDNRGQFLEVKLYLGRKYYQY